jgi:hypothetical protein
MTNITLQNTVIGSGYDKVIDTEFRTFGANATANLGQVTLEQFFQEYNDLFYQIPKEGDLESHTFILNKTIEYLGVKLADDESIQALLEEIHGLKQQILDSNKKIAYLCNTTKK